MRNNAYRIEGKVIRARTRQPLAHLRVEAWDKDLIYDDLIGSTVTEQAGNSAKRRF